MLGRDGEFLVQFIGRFEHLHRDHARLCEELNVELFGYDFDGVAGDVQLAQPSIARRP